LRRHIALYAFDTPALSRRPITLYALFRGDIALLALYLPPLPPHPSSCERAIYHHQQQQQLDGSLDSSLDSSLDGSLDGRSRALCRPR
jgi:hypothetical protein